MGALTGPETLRRFMGLMTVVAAVSCAAAGTRSSGFAVTDALWASAAGAVLVRSATRAPSWATGVGSLGLVFTAGNWGATACTAVATTCLALDLRRDADTIGAARESRLDGAVLSAGAAVVASVALRVPESAGTPGRLASLVAFVVPVMGTPVSKQLAGRWLDRWRDLSRTKRSVGSVCAVGVVVLLGLAGTVMAGRARETIETVNRGTAQLRGGDASAAAESFRTSARSSGDLARWLASPIGWPMRTLPLVGRQTHGALLSARAATAVTANVAATLEDLDRRSPLRNGALDLSALEQLRVGLMDIDRALDNLDKGLADSQTAWLPAAVVDRLESGRAQASAARKQSLGAVHAIELAGSLLGGRNARTLFIAFITPAEARGLGGLMGNYAEVRTSGGQIALTSFGRTSQLIERTPPTKLNGAHEFLQRYGRYGAASRAGLVADPGFWSNVTMSPDLPSVAEAMAQLYSASGGVRPDSVIAVDPEGLRAILQLVGPVTVGVVSPRTFSADNIVQYLLRDQYLADETTRTGVLRDITDSLIASLSKVDSEVLRTGAALGSVVRGGHIQLWSFDPNDQKLLRSLDVSGPFPEPGTDGFALTFANANPNKIDSFLTSSASYRAIVDDANHTIRSSLNVELHNAAPPSGLPETVIGNQTGATWGTNTTIMSVYSPLADISVVVNGEATPASLSVERGWHVATFPVRIPPGGRANVKMSLTGAYSGDRYVFVTRSQPMVSPMRVKVDVRSSSGRRLVALERVPEGVTKIRDAAIVRKKTISESEHSGVGR